MDYRKMIARKMHKNEEDHNHTASVALALLAGAAVGAALTLLLAPKSGAETRSLITDKTKALASGMKDKLSRARSKAEEEFHDLSDRAKEKYKSARRKVRQNVEDLTNNVHI